MKRFLFTSVIFVLGLISMSCAQKQQQKTQQKIQKESESEWITLFNGQSTKHWRGYNKEQFPEKGWVVKNETLTALPGEGGGTIITKDKYCNFVLKLEWKVGKGANSGILYRALEQPNQAIHWSAPEMQVLDDANYPDANKAGSLYDVIPADPQNAKPYGEWNSVKIVADGAHVEQWQNGKKVVEYELWTPEWYQKVRNSKFVDHPAFGDMRCGYIGLQDHGGNVSFRNVKVKKLD